MSECKIEVVVGLDRELIIWCDTCKENVAITRESFTLEEVVATAEGHLKVMANCKRLHDLHSDDDGADGGDDVGERV